MDTNDKLEIKAGTGYWDLTIYPWGGCFRRMRQDTVVVLKHIVKRYNDNTPQWIICDMNGTEIGIEL